MPNINTNKAYDKMTLRERYKVYNVYEKYKDSFSEQEKKEFSMTPEEIAKEIKRLNQLELRRRRIIANKAILCAQRKELQNQKRELQLKLKDESISDEEKNNIKNIIKELNEQLKQLKEHIAKINIALKEEIPSLAEIQKTRSRYRKIRGFKTIKGTYKRVNKDITKVPPEKNENLENDSEKNIPKKDISLENNEPSSDTSPYVIFIPKGDYLPEFNSEEIKYAIKCFREDNKVRKAHDNTYSYIIPILDNQSDEVLDCKFVVESLTDKDNNNVIFAKKPLKAYKKALNEKFSLIKKLHFFDYSDIELYRKKRKLLKNFKNDLKNGDFDYCVEKFIAIKTALTKDELSFVMEKNQYPLDDYNVTKTSFTNQVKKSLFRKPTISFEHCTIDIGTLHSERKKAQSNPQIKQPQNSSQVEKPHNQISHTKNHDKDNTIDR